MDVMTDSIKAAAQHLTELRHTGRFGARLSEANRPATIDAALRIQDRTVRVLGDAVGGYKCSVPTAEKAAVLAPIFAATIGSAIPCLVRAATPTAGDTARIEPEVAFVLGRDLPARAEPYSEDEVRAAIGEVRLVLELLGSRYRETADVPFAEMLADCISNQGLFVGPVVRRGLDAALTEFALRVERAQPAVRDSAGVPELFVAQQGRHPDGHPLRPLVWLANFLAARGTGLHAGQIVTTGSYAGMIDVPLATPLRIEFGDLGEIEVEFQRMES
ncbi:MAG: 2-keto-4-pentenoate hydratase [Betaproteobacteria bacterium]